MNWERGHDLRGEAERDLLELLRGDSDFGLMMMRQDGKCLVYATTPPFGEKPGELGVADSMDKAWHLRISIPAGATGTSAAFGGGSAATAGNG